MILTGSLWEVRYHIHNFKKKGHVVFEQKRIGKYNLTATISTRAYPDSALWNRKV